MKFKKCKKQGLSRCKFRSERRIPYNQQKEKKKARRWYCFYEEVLPFWAHVAGISPSRKQIKPRRKILQSKGNDLQTHFFLNKAVSVLQTLRRAPMWLAVPAW